MGGFGSGRPASRDATGDYLALDIRKLRRDGLLRVGGEVNLNWSRGGDHAGSIRYRVEAGRLVLLYRTRDRGGEWQDMEYPVRLSWTHPNYGGTRPWFLCPAKGCGQRVAILYGGSIFACRHCHKLAYQCQRETDDDRAVRRADTIRRRLGWEPGILNGDGWKPKGMHWRTFERLKAEHDARVNVSLAGMMQRFKIAKPNLE